MAGIGGTVRNLASVVMLEEELPSFGVQGFSLERTALEALIERLAEMTPAERRRVPGLKPERGDLILAGAVVVATVMDVCRFDALEVTEAGLREGVFYEELLAGASPPLLPDVRAAAVRNLAAQYHPDEAHTEHVAFLALEMWDALSDAGMHPGRADERELLWAAAMLHDIGTAVDYDDHHKHSRYLILNAGLPGFSPRETAIIGQAARYHRKGHPGMRMYAPLARKGDEELLARCSALLRIAEQLERSRDQSIQHAHVAVEDGTVELRLESEGDIAVSRWGALRQADVFKRAFDRDLAVVA
jgi:exopolyphosphatase/guanosine-5'-triphosphate,3'-diphosphate pyrophosphatase